MKRFYLIIFVCVQVWLLLLTTISGINITSDSREYLELADSLENNHSISINGYPVSFRTPGYPLFLTLLKIIGLGESRGIVLTQSILAGIKILMIFHLARVLFSNKISWFVLVLSLLNPGLYLQTTSILSESLFSFLLVFMVWLFYIFNQKPRVKWLLIGILCGCLALIRPIALWLFIPLSFYLIYIIIRKKLNWKTLALFLIGVTFTQSTWVMRNYMIYDTPYFTEISAASLYVYWSKAIESKNDQKNPQSYFDEGWDEWHAAQEVLSPPEMKQVFTQKAINTIFSNPITTLQIAVEGVIRHVIDSSFMKLLIVNFPENNFSLSDLSEKLFFPENSRNLLIISIILIARMFELVMIITVLVMSFYNSFINLFSKNVNDQTWCTINFVALLILYLFLFSIGPATNERFRGQYFDLAILLAGPYLYLSFKRIISL